MSNKILSLRNRHGSAQLRKGEARHLEGMLTESNEAIKKALEHHRLYRIKTTALFTLDPNLYSMLPPQLQKRLPTLVERKKQTERRAKMLSDREKKLLAIDKEEKERKQRRKERQIQRNEECRLEFQQQTKQEKKTLDTRPHLEEEKQNKDRVRQSKDEEILQNMKEKKGHKNKKKTKGIFKGAAWNSAGSQPPGQFPTQARPEKVVQEITFNNVFCAFIQETPFRIWASISSSLAKHQYYQTWRTTLSHFLSNNCVFGKTRIVKLKATSSKGKRNFYEVRHPNLDIRLVGRRWTISQLEQMQLYDTEINFILEQIHEQTKQDLCPLSDSLLWFDQVAEKHHFITTIVLGTKSMEKLSESVVYKDNERECSCSS